MDPEKNLEQQFSELQAIAKENKDIDVASLMVSAMEKQDQNMVAPNKKRWAYFISVGAPPFGLIFAIKYYFSDEEDAQHVALVCVILTALSIGAFLLFSNLLFKSSGVSTEQIQQIKPGDILELTK